MNWLEILSKDENRLDDFVKQYTDELANTKSELKLDGHVEKLAREMPSITDKRFSQLQEVEAILELFTIRMKAERGKLYKHLLEHYKRSLTSRDVEKYIDAEVSVIEYLEKINKILLLRNKFAGVTKALEVKHFQITNIVKLKSAGLDDNDIGL